MFFATDFWGHIVAIVVGVILGLMLLMIAKFLSWSATSLSRYVVFPLLVSSDGVRIYEAGHIVAYLKSLKNLNKTKYIKKAKRIEQMTQTRISGCVTINLTEWNQRHRLLLMGGVAAQLKFNNMRMNRIEYSKRFWLMGCMSDFLKLRYRHNMSKSEIINETNQMINSFSDKDVTCIKKISDTIADKPGIKSNSRFVRRKLTKSELLTLAESYYDN